MREGGGRDEGSEGKESSGRMCGIMYACTCVSGYFFVFVVCDCHVSCRILL